MKYIAIIEQIRKEAYDKGFDVGRMLNTGKYEKGLSDAWEAARKIAKLDAVEQKRLFGCIGIYFVAQEFSAQEAIKKIRQYEQEQEEKEW